MSDRQITLYNQCFMWRDKDGVVKPNDTNAAVRVYAELKAPNDAGGVVDITSDCDIHQEKVDDFSGLHTIEVIYRYDDDLTPHTHYHMKYIVLCYNTGNSNEHMVLTAEAPRNQKYHNMLRLRKSSM